MNPKITRGVRDAVMNQSGGPVELPDDDNVLYVVMTRQRFQDLVYDDSDLTPDEMNAAAVEILDDPEGWGASGMERYDDLSPSPNS